MSEAVETIPEKRSGGAGQFVGEVREELKKTSFPSGENVRNTTIIVIVNVIFFAIFLFLIDQAWVNILAGLEWLINRIAGF